MPLGEIVSGIAMVTGFGTPLFAFVAFFMALNFHVASGALFRYSFLTNGYGLPVLGSTLALAVAGGSRRIKKLKRKPKNRDSSRRRVLRWSASLSGELQRQCTRRS